MTVKEIRNPIKSYVDIVGNGNERLDAKLVGRASYRFVCQKKLLRIFSLCLVTENFWHSLEGAHMPHAESLCTGSISTMDFWCSM